MLQLELHPLALRGKAERRTATRHECAETTSCFIPDAGVCRVPLSGLITFEPPRLRLRRFSASKQKRLDLLMAGNNDGRLTRAEQRELQALVREAEELTLENSRTLANQRRELAAR